MATTSAEFDAYNSIKWTAIANSAILILYSVVNTFDHFVKLDDEGEHHSAFYETHGYNVVESLVQILIAGYGIFALFGEEYPNVRCFAVSITIVLVYKVIAVILDANSERMIALIMIVLLVILSWLFLSQIYNKLRSNVQPIDRKGNVPCFYIHFIDCCQDQSVFAINSVINRSLVSVLVKVNK